jgi:AraC-like DNA-binding protein
LNDIIDDIYMPLLVEHGFTAQPNNDRFGAMGLCWSLSEQIGQGYYWTYGQKNLFDIKIHDFYFHEDSFLEFNLPQCLSITQYESISGEELTPYRRLAAGCIKTIIGGYKPYKILVHKKIPVRCIGIEIMPAYYEDHLKKQYPGEYANPYDAFRCVDQTTNFPEMAKLLSQVKNYRGQGFSAKLFYEAKVAEAVSLVFEQQKKSLTKSASKLSAQDLEQLEAVTAYINDHFAFDLPLQRLSQIACMGMTKLKSSFKLYHNCTITEYIQQRRMSQAEHLLSATDLTIGQVAQTVGYSNAGRFAELFRLSTGLLPGEYRKISFDSSPNIKL